MEIRNNLSRQLATLILLIISFSLFSQTDEVQQAIQHRIEAGMEQEGLRVGDIYLFNQDSLTKYYTKREFQPIWTDENDRQDFITVIKGSFDEGLLPYDYHVEDIKSLESEYIDSKKVASE